jgi:CxxC motif-containing protein (DUF1111 family)
VETAIVTGQEVVLANGHAEITAEGLTLRLTPLCGTTVERVEPHAYHMHDGSPAVIRRIVLAPSRANAKSTLGYVAELVEVPGRR